MSSPPDDEYATAYGDEAVDRPLDKALAYGDAAVASGLRAQKKGAKKAPSGSTVEDVKRLISELHPIFLEKFSRKIGGEKVTYGPHLVGTPAFEIVSESNWRATVEQEAQRLAEVAKKVFLKFAPEFLQKKLQEYYASQGQPFPNRLTTMNEKTQLTKEEDSIVLGKIRALTSAQARDADQIGAIYSPGLKKIFFRESQIDAGTVAHEMAHAYADEGWHDFITLMTVRAMNGPAKLDEGMTVHAERIVVNAWHQKQPGATTIPLARYDSSYTGRATKFLADVGKHAGYEAYFGGWVDFTNNDKPEDSLKIGRSTKKSWKWPWR